MINKKAGYNWAHFFLYFIIVSFVLIFMFLVIKAQQAEKFYDVVTNKKEIEDNMVFNKFIDVCLSHEDEETGRVYTGVLDLEKFTEETIGNCFEGDARLYLKGTKKKDLDVVKIREGKNDGFTPDFVKTFPVLVEGELWDLRVEVANA